LKSSSKEAPVNLDEIVLPTEPLPLDIIKDIDIINDIHMPEVPIIEVCIYVYVYLHMCINIIIIILNIRFSILSLMWMIAYPSSLLGWLYVVLQIFLGIPYNPIP
jgi:hypothetical protein